MARLRSICALERWRMQEMRRVNPGMRINLSGQPRDED